MRDEMALEQHWWSWELSDNFSLVRNAPFVIDPETGKEVDPTVISLTYGWDGDEWFLLAAEVTGPARDEHGMYPDESDTLIEYFDPVRGDDSVGVAPGWLIEIANRRMCRLPRPVDLSGVFDE